MMPTSQIGKHQREFCYQQYYNRPLKEVEAFNTSSESDEDQFHDRADQEDSVYSHLLVPLFERTPIYLHEFQPSHSISTTAFLGY